MSLRTLTEDVLYAGTGVLGRLAGAWAGAPRGVRRTVAVLMVVVVLAVWLGPKLDLFSGSRSGFTAEELRLIEQAGKSEPVESRLPWWYTPNE